MLVLIMLIFVVLMLVVMLVAIIMLVLVMMVLVVNVAVLVSMLMSMKMAMTMLVTVMVTMVMLVVVLKDLDLLVVALSFVPLLSGITVGTLVLKVVASDQRSVDELAKGLLDATLGAAIVGTLLLHDDLEVLLAADAATDLISQGLTIV